MHFSKTGSFYFAKTGNYHVAVTVFHLWGQVLFFAFTHTNSIYAKALDRGDPVLFINGQANVAKSHPEDSRYLCRFHPRNEIFNAFV